MPDTDDIQQIPAGEELPSAPPESQKPTRKTAGRGSSALPVFANLEIERQVIAALIVDGSCLATVGSILGGLNAQNQGGRKKRSGDQNELKREMYHGVATTIFHD